MGGVSRLHQLGRFGPATEGAHAYLSASCLGSNPRKYQHRSEPRFACRDIPSDMSGDAATLGATLFPYGSRGTMNRPQQVLVWLAVSCAAFVLLYPPWTHTGHFSHLGFAGYGWVFAPPPRASIALAQLVIQLLLMGVVLGAGYVLLGRAKWSPSATKRTFRLFGKIAVSLVATLVAGVANRVSIANGGGWEGGAAIALGYLGFLGWLWRKPAAPQSVDPASRPRTVSAPRPAGVPPQYIRRPKERRTSTPRRGVWLVAATIPFAALAVWGGAQWLEAADSARETEITELEGTLHAISEERAALMREWLRGLADAVGAEERKAMTSHSDAANGVRARALAAERARSALRQLEEREAEIRLRLKALNAQ